MAGHSEHVRISRSEREGRMRIVRTKSAVWHALQSIVQAAAGHDYFCSMLCLSAFSSLLSSWHLMPFPMAW